MEEWAQINTFPGYSVSNRGRVRNDDSGRMMGATPNQQGIYQVGLTREGVYYKRSVTKLVARHFLVPDRNETFDTPIQLDGDRRNNDVCNLVWRPRWFAVLYHSQFKRPYRNRIRRPFMDMATRIVTENSLETARAYGLLEKDVVMSTLNRTFCWPTYQIFKIVPTDI